MDTRADEATCVLTINEQRLDALEIGTRLAADGRLGQASAVSLLTFDEPRVAVGGGEVDTVTIGRTHSGPGRTGAARGAAERHRGEVPPASELAFVGGADADTDTSHIAGAPGSTGRLRDH